MKKMNALLSVLVAVAVCLSDPASAAKPTSCSVTPYTGRIAYTTGVIHICNIATGVDTNTGFSGVNPNFSAQGDRIVFQGSAGITVINSSAPYSPYVLTSVGGKPSFDPTGAYIAFDNGGIWTMGSANGSVPTQITSDGGIQPTWSEDGSAIAYNAPSGGSQQLFTVTVDANGVWSSPMKAKLNASIIDTVWRPGATILFGLLQSNKNYELYSYDPVLNVPNRLTSNKGNDFEPSWSPDGTHISWTSGLGGIWIMEWNGSNPIGPVIPNGRQGSWGPTYP